jgi:hypothetical protein
MKLTTHLQLVLKLSIHGAISPPPLYVFVVWFLINHRDNFTFISDKSRLVQ